MSDTTIAYVIQGSTIVVTVNGRGYTVEKDTHLHYKEVLEALQNEDYDKVAELVDVGKVVKEFYDSEGNTDIEIKNGGVYYKGQRIHNTLTDRLLEMYKQKLPMAPLVQFLRNLLENPSYTSVNELYRFLERNALPITTDGHFLAYKRVHILAKDADGNSAGDFVDTFTKKVNNNIGKTPYMNRRDVDDNSSKTCSKGLHFCSLAYLQQSGYGGGANSTIVVVKINPRDVVSIPKDYNDSKGRCCRYTVLYEHDGDENKDTLSESLVMQA